MSKLDYNAERARLQAMRDHPQTDLERAIKKDVLDKGSEPKEWSDDTVESAHLMFRVYAMGWQAAQPVSEQPDEAKRWSEVYYGSSMDKGWNIKGPETMIHVGEGAEAESLVRAIVVAHNNTIDRLSTPRLSEPAAPSPQISDEEILKVAAEHGYGWARERGVIPFSAVEDDGAGIVNLFRALLSRKEGK